MREVFQQRPTKTEQQMQQNRLKTSQTQKLANSQGISGQPPATKNHIQYVQKQKT